MNKIMKFFAMMGLCFVTSVGFAGDNYKPKNPVEKVNRSLSSVEKKVRNAAVKVKAGGGHGSGTVVNYRDVTLVLTAKHVADGRLGMEY